MHILIRIIPIICFLSLNPRIRRFAPCSDNFRRPFGPAQPGGNLLGGAYKLICEYVTIFFCEGQHTPSFLKKEQDVEIHGGGPLRAGVWSTKKKSRFALFDHRTSGLKRGKENRL